MGIPRRKIISWDLHLSESDRGRSDLYFFSGHSGVDFSPRNAQNVAAIFNLRSPPALSRANGFGNSVCQCHACVAYHCRGCQPPRARAKIFQAWRGGRARSLSSPRPARFPNATDSGSARHRRSIAEGTPSTIPFLGFVDPYEEFPAENYKLGPAPV